MGKWYRKTAAKAVVLTAGVLSAAVFLTSLIAATTLAGTSNPVEITKLVNEPYEESGDFNMAVESAMSQVFLQFQLEDFFEMDGAYNPDKVIDIMEYYRGDQVSGQNLSGVAYTLGELEEWGADFSIGEGELYSDNGVIVCQKPDGSYYYYYLDEFLALFENGELSMELTGGYMDQEDYLGGLKSGTYTSSGDVGDMRILDKEGREVYTSCWNFGMSLREMYAPRGGENLLQVVNSSPELNGKLSEIYTALESLLAVISDNKDIYESGWEYLEEGNTNFTYLYINTKTKKIETNKSEYKNYEDVESSLEKMKSGEHIKYVFIYPKLRDFETNMNLSATGEWERVRNLDDDRDVERIFAAAVDTSYPVKDQFYEGQAVYEKNVPFLRLSMISLIAGAAVSLIAAVWITLTAGRRAEDEEIHLTAFDRWKTEFAAIAVLMVWGCVTWVIIGGGYVTGSWEELSEAVTYYTDQQGGLPQVYFSLIQTAIGLADIAAVFFYGVFTALCLFWGYTSLVRRIKAKILWKGSFVRAVISFGARVLRARSVTARVGAALLVYFLIQWLAVLSRTLPMFLLSLAADAWAAWIVLNGALAKNRIQKGIEQIASGNLEYRIELKGLRGADRELAEKVNDIGSGLNRAVDEAMRNERLKTDLITNVSHDIKTPLTSIINYVDILKRSHITDEKIRGYLDILEAKAQRLKTLTEDVVEASKVSSGNITLEYMDVDLRELVQQTEGELAEKFAARNLTVVLNMPEDPAVIHVDGRRMWRVLENIYGNAAKYAMPGTRVYADLVLEEDQVVFSLKNVSEQPLNFSADELTERFIRGDISRSTEGSGLCLSIDKSLTAMQGGEFELYLDGDLFRVNICFPRVKSPQKQQNETEMERDQDFS